MKWSNLAEHKIQKARAEGQLDGLKGAGKPLSVDQGDNIVSAGFRIMAREGVIPREIELKKQVEEQRRRLNTEDDPAQRKREMKRLADLELLLTIEREARLKYFSAG